MPTGLRIPVGVNKSGGANIETDEASQNRKLLILALSEGQDNNPFQNLGGFRELIFQIRNAGVRARAESRLRQILAKYSDRIQLSTDLPIEFSTANEAEVELSFSYIDLLTNTIEEFRQTFKR